jgi:hypothetical protein
MGLAGSGFTITVPDSWFELDVAPHSRDRSIDSLVYERARLVPELTAHRPALRRLLRRVAREAHAGGVVFCAVMVEAVDGLGMCASVTVTLIGATEANGLVPHDASAIAAALPEKTAAHEEDTWQTVSVLDLPQVGRAARTKSVEDVQVAAGARPVRSVVMQTFIPMHREGGVAVVTCNSPNVGLADEYLDLFDAITSTFRFTNN